jgi:hypothetical protein
MAARESFGHGLSVVHDTPRMRSREHPR